jgi:hypothetical protein
VHFLDVLLTQALVVLFGVELEGLADAGGVSVLL